VSVASQKGKRLEQLVAKMIRSKLGARVTRDKRSGAGDTTKTDIKDWYRETDFDIEVKDQETIKLKEWMRQAIGNASYSRIATLVLRMDEEIIAAVKFEDLLNMAVELRDARAELADLRRPDNPVTPLDARGVELAGNASIGKVVSRAVKRGSETCRNGHLADTWGYCLQLGCKFSRAYRQPKSKPGKNAA